MSLLPLSAARTALATTEPVEAISLQGVDQIEFEVGPLWPGALEGLSDLDLSPITLVADGERIPLTVRAAINAGGAHGLTEPYIRRSSSMIYSALLNYHYGSINDRALKALCVGGAVQAFVRPSISVYSNTRILDAVVDEARRINGDAFPILVDGSTHNNMMLTQIRLVFPSLRFNIDGAWMLDVPSGEKDDWSPGIQITNSVMGKQSTNIEAFLYRHHSGSAITLPHNDVPVWSRSRESMTTVEEWAARSTKKVMTDFRKAFESIQALQKVRLYERWTDVMLEAFKPSKIQKAVMNNIGERLFDYDDITLYHLLVSGSIEALNPDLTVEHSDRLVKYSGQIVKKQGTFDALRDSVEPPARLKNNPYVLGGRN